MIEGGWYLLASEPAILQQLPLPFLCRPAELGRHQVGHPWGRGRSTRFLQDSDMGATGQHILQRQRQLAPADMNHLRFDIRKVGNQSLPQTAVGTR